MVPGKIKNTYSIEQVAEIADVNSFTLRNWEDRYRLFNPERDVNGRRMFSETDALKAMYASELVKRDFKIGKIAAELLEASDPSPVFNRYLESEHFVNLREAALRSLIAFDPIPFRNAFDHLISNFTIEFLANHFFYPVFRQLENLQSEQSINDFQARFAHYHLASRIHRLIGLVELNRIKRANKKIIIAGLPGNVYEDSLLLLYLILERQGWEVFYGGVQASIPEFVEAIGTIGAEAATLIGNNLSTEEYRTHEPALSQLQIPVAIGGKLALKLLSENRVAPDNIEWTSLRPVHWAKLMNYKLL